MGCGCCGARYKGNAQSARLRLAQRRGVKKVIAPVAAPVVEAAPATVITTNTDQPVEDNSQEQGKSRND